MRCVGVREKQEERWRKGCVCGGGCKGARRRREGRERERERERDEERENETLEPGGA